MSVNNLQIRLNYRGGKSQIARMNKDKLKSLEYALMNSYQAATAKLSDGREFKCLINPDKINEDVDNKILSIPYKAICLNASPSKPEDDNNDGSSSPSVPPTDNDSEGEFWEDMEDLVATLSLAAIPSLASEGVWEDMEDPDAPTPPEDDPEEPEDDPVTPEVIPTEKEDVGIKEGDVICWKENGSHWIVYLQRLEETAYFRADLRRCRYQLTLGNGSSYWTYVRGPVEKTLSWIEESNNYVNKLNHTLILYISQNEETLKYFNRFKKVIIHGKPWEVQAIDSISTPGIIEMSLKETYTNSIQDNLNEVIKQIDDKNKVIEQDTAEPYILGESEVYPYEVHHYELRNYNGRGRWYVSNESRSNMIKLIDNTDVSVEIQIITGKSGSFTLLYKEDANIITELQITIQSL